MVKLHRTFLHSLLNLLPLLFLFTEATAQQWHKNFVPRERVVNSLKWLGPESILFGGGNEFNDSIQDIWSSTDMGMNWSLTNYDPGQPWIKSLAFSDTLHGIAVGYTGEILKTDDGAHTWTRIPWPINRQFHKAIYTNATTIFIAGGSKPGADTTQTILKSTDSGNTWSVMRDTAGYWFRGISFYDMNNGIVVGDHGTIYKTSNSGATWNKISSPVTYNLYAAYFLNSSVGFIVGGYDSSLAAGVMLKTIDGGSSWSVILEDTQGVLKDITFSSSNIGYAVGGKGRLLKTINAGSAWSPQVLPGITSNTSFNCVEFKNDNQGMIGGYFGDLYIYNNSQLPYAITLGARYKDSATFTLSGAVNTHDEIGTYTFRYGTDSTLESYFTAFYMPPDVKTDTTNFVYADISVLTDSTYYFVIEARTVSGSVYGDTLSFFTHKPSYILETRDATNIASGAATLNGFADKFSSDITLSFEYGTTLQFGSVITATPSAINDTLPHTISANLSGITPNVIYYYRIKAIHNGFSYYGDIKAFFNGVIYDTLLTLAATSVTDTTVTLNGYVNKFYLPANIVFEYGTSPSLGSTIPAAFINDTFPHNISVGVDHLTSASAYYFRISARTILDTIVGNTLVFFTGLSYVFFNTLEPTNITSNSAQLNAAVTHLSNPTHVYFEFGTTTSFGDTIAVTPSVISDTGVYSITAQVTNLQPDRFYYYRLVGESGSGTVYGDTKQFYAGISEIPNWDFQLWNEDTIQIPKHWNALLDSFERVPGHTGYAIRVFGMNLVTNGLVGNDFFGGTPFASRPDSIVAYANFNIAAGDSAGMLALFKKNGVIIDSAFMIVFGSTADTFKRIATKINYHSAPSVIPDSVMIAIASTFKLGGPSPYLHNSISIDDISFEPGHQTVPNGNFEDWFPTFLQSPLYWMNIRYYGLDSSDMNANHMVSKAFFNAPDDFAALIQNIEIPIIGVGGGALDTHVNPFNDSRAGDFAVRGKHISLNGYYKYIPVGNDTLDIEIAMTRNDTIVGQGRLLSSTPVADFAHFTIPIEYSGNTIPDSAIIQFKFIGPVHLGTKLYIDKLSFDGFVPVNVPKPELVELDGMKVYPNPARDFIIVENLPTENKSCTLTLINIHGQTVREIKLMPQETRAQLEVSDIDAGIYLLVLRKGEKSASKKIMIQR